MTIEIKQHELESLLLLRMKTGRYSTVEEALIEALKRSSDTDHGAMPHHTQNLLEVCAMVNSLSDDLDFSRDPSPGRPVSIP